jgi:hypothetical protein
MKINFFSLLCAALILGSMLPTNSFADMDLKLFCTITGVARTPYKNSDYKEEFIVEISEIGNHTFIISNSEYFGSVTTTRDEKTLALENYSDKNKWNIKKSVLIRGNVNLTNHIVIDRNTGVINNRFDGELVTFISSGKCSKVNTNQRLF